jgi:hypothetical protein
LAARCCWFHQGRYKESRFAVSVELVLGSDCALPCEVMKTNNGSAC